MTSGILFNDYKEQIIRAAQKSQIMEGCDENGHPLYKTVTKEEAVDRIKELYDETIYQFEQVRTSGIAIEKLLHRYIPDLDEKKFFQDYMDLVEEERSNSDYRFEITEDDRDILKSIFTIIDGGKQDNDRN